MRSFLVGTVCLLVILIAGCASVTVKTDYDPEYDFETVNTYRWATEHENKPDDVLAENPFIRKRIMLAVDKAMKTKGLEKRETGEADLVVLAHVGVKERMQVHHTGGYHRACYRGWYDPWWGPYGGSTYVSYYEEGTLIIDLVSWENKELAWRGMGTGMVRDFRDSRKQQEYFDKVVAQIMAPFPPD